MTNNEIDKFWRIRKIRKHLGLTQKVFAKRLGVGEATAVRWEAGTADPGMDGATRMLEMVPGLDAVWLLTGEGEMFPPSDVEVRVLLSRLEEMLAESSGDEENDNRSSHMGTMLTLASEIARRKGLEPVRKLLVEASDAFFGLVSQKYWNSIWWHPDDDHRVRELLKKHGKEFFGYEEDSDEVQGEGEPTARTE